MLSVCKSIVKNHLKLLPWNAEIRQSRDEFLESKIRIDLMNFDPMQPMEFLEYGFTFLRRI